MDDNEFVVFIGTLRVRVNLVGNSVSGPTSVRNTAMGLQNAVKVQICFHCNRLSN